jgi:hypothetical protein
LFLFFLLCALASYFTSHSWFFPLKVLSVWKRCYDLRSKPQNVERQNVE